MDLQTKQKTYDKTVGTKLAEMIQNGDKNSKRLLQVERESAALRQDLQSHKLEKARQLGALDIKTKDYEVFKHSIQKQIETVHKSSERGVMDNRTQLNEIKAKLDSVQSPMRQQLSDLVMQSELIEREFDRCQAINRKLVRELVAAIERVNGAGSRDGTPRVLGGFEASQESPTRERGHRGSQRSKASSRRMQATGSSGTNDKTRNAQQYSQIKGIHTGDSLNASNDEPQF